MENLALTQSQTFSPRLIFILRISTKVKVWGWRHVIQNWPQVQFRWVYICYSWTYRTCWIELSTVTWFIEHLLLHLGTFPCCRDWEVATNCFPGALSVRVCDVTNAFSSAQPARTGFSGRQHPRRHSVEELEAAQFLLRSADPYLAADSQLPHLLLHNRPPQDLVVLKRNYISWFCDVAALRLGGSAGLIWNSLMQPVIWLLSWSWRGYDGLPAISGASVLAVSWVSLSKWSR